MSRPPVTKPLRQATERMGVCDERRSLCADGVTRPARRERRYGGTSRGIVRGVCGKWRGTDRERRAPRGHSGCHAAGAGGTDRGSGVDTRSDVEQDVALCAGAVAPTRLSARGRSLLERASLPLSKREGAVGSVVFTSAATGLPPFYGVSLASGAVGMRMSAFVLTGSAGRFLRFSALAWFGRRLGSSTLESVHGLALALPFVGG